MTWTVAGDAPELFAHRLAAARDPPTSGTFNVSGKFVELAKIRDPASRSRSVSLCSIACCGGCGRTTTCSRSRPIRTWTRLPRWPRRCAATSTRCTPSSASAKSAASDKAHFVAWFEPEHHIVELAAPFFARRFADMPWSILTPDLCAHWDGHAVSFTPGVNKSGGAHRRSARGNLAAATTPASSIPRG